MLLASGCLDICGFEFVKEFGVFVFVMCFISLCVCIYVCCFVIFDGVRMYFTEME